ncbi:MAG: PLP-dependent aminotransferase family protein [Desulfurococcales archaeon]|nr:PLP-dependent aminotransferase family protein [Desulfurococcales archaeon]
MVDGRLYAAKRLSKFKASEIRELLKLTEGKDIISFAGGLPDPSIFDKEDLAEIARNVILEKGDKALQYSPTLGVTSFRQELLKFTASHGVKVKDTDDVIVTTGSQEALYIIGRVFVDPGDIVIVEEPTYLAALNVFRQYDANLIGIPIDNEGMRIDILENVLEDLNKKGLKPKLLYSVPTAQNPSGVTMSNDRRKRLLELAHEYDFLIVEDDPYSFFLFEEESFDYLKTLDPNGRVMYVCTLSKIMAPGLRIGWVVADKSIISLLELAKQAIDLHTATLPQYIAEEALRQGVVAKTISRAKVLYAKKRDAMLKALEEEMSDIATWIRPIGGFFTMVFLNDKDIDTYDLMYEAIEEGVAYVPGKSFYVNPERGKHSMRLNFSYPTIEQIWIGIARLSKVVRKHLAVKQVERT